MDGGPFEEGLSFTIKCALEHRVTHIRWILPLDLFEKVDCVAIGDVVTVVSESYELVEVVCRLEQRRGTYITLIELAYSSRTNREDMGVLVNLSTATSATESMAARCFMRRP